MQQLWRGLVFYWESRRDWWGAIIIIRSLILVCVCALPFMAAVMFNEDQSVPVFLSYLFIIGVLIAHIGFFIGILHLTWESYVKRARRR